MRLQQIKSRFRCLKAWHVTLAPKNSKYHACVTIHPTKPQAIVYRWEIESAEPEDFKLHEILHVAFEAIRRLPKNNRREAEELLIQDICSLLVNNINQEKY